jgi:hypothetical protein
VKNLIKGKRLNMCPIASGNWNNGSNAGVWTMNWNNSRTNSNDNVGFRSDSDSPHTAKAYSGAKGDVFLYMRISYTKSAAYSISSRCLLKTFESHGVSS